MKPTTTNPYTNLDIPPSIFYEFPMGSVMQKSEPETIARNIMVILKRTGDKFRELPFEEYKEEREKDGEYSGIERLYFESVTKYCSDAKSASLFSPVWEEALSEYLSEHQQDKPAEVSDTLVVGDLLEGLEFTFTSDKETDSYKDIVMLKDKVVAWLNIRNTPDEWNLIQTAISQAPVLYKENKELKDKAELWKNNYAVCEKDRQDRILEFNVWIKIVSDETNSTNARIQQLEEALNKISDECIKVLSSGVDEDTRTISFKNLLGAISETAKAALTTKS